ncbi:hypothetical protein LL06_23670 [Hoeflea sp. BAL378]|nr:hypothetical protein LL06_23670 [Hoeflea sp. BAL378]
MAAPGAPGRRAGVVAAAVALCAWSTAAPAEDLSWAGWQTDDGGRVVWGIPESDAFVSFTCNSNGTVEFWNDGALPDDFLKNPVLRVKVDGTEFSFRGDAQFNEMNDAYEGTATLAGSDPFLKAVASGTSMQIYDLINGRYSSGTIPLKGTGRLFARYLSGCLTD